MAILYLGQVSVCGGQSNDSPKVVHLPIQVLEKALANREPDRLLRRGGYLEDRGCAVVAQRERKGETLGNDLFQLLRTDVPTISHALSRTGLMSFLNQH